MLNRMGEANSQLRTEVERIRDSGILGDARLRRLFEYLASSSLQGHAPKEIAIAMEVFGKGVDFDVSQDALVRVYIHKLRRTLGDYYSKAGGGSGHAVHIPRGEYRLVVTVNSVPDPDPDDPAPRLPERAGAGAPARVIANVARAIHDVVAGGNLDRLWDTLAADAAPACGPNPYQSRLLLAAA